MRDDEATINGNDFSQSSSEEVAVHEVGFRITQYVDLKMDTVNVRMEGIQNELRASLDGKLSVTAFWGGVATIILSVAALAIGVLSFGSEQFIKGLSVSPVISEIEEQQRVRDARQDDTDMRILRELEKLNAKLEAGPADGQN